MSEPSFEHTQPFAEAVTTLVERITRAATPGTRFVLGVAGSPGSGKTTLAKALAAFINDREVGAAAYLPMDGFHLSNATLDRLGIHDRKGAIETFDAWGFLALVQRVRTETDHTVYAPSFTREVDEGVAGAIGIQPEARIVIVEGNYLLIDQHPWSALRDLFDESWFCSTAAAEREARLIDRHTRHGRSLEAATAWAKDVDGANAVLIEETRARAELVLSGVTGEVLSVTSQS